MFWPSFLLNFLYNHPWGVFPLGHSLAWWTGIWTWLLQASLLPLLLLWVGCTCTQNPSKTRELLPLLSPHSPSSPSLSLYSMSKGLQPLHFLQPSVFPGVWGIWLTVYKFNLATCFSSCSIQGSWFFWHWCISIDQRFQSQCSWADSRKFTCMSPLASSLLCCGKGFHYLT